MDIIAEFMQLDKNLHQTQFQCMFKLLSKHNIHSGQPPILAYLYRNKSSNQRDIAHHLGVSRASVGKSLERMEKEELICRQVAKEDTRYNTVSLTEKGVEAARLATQTLNNLYRQEIEGFTDEEIKLLSSFYKRMTENLDNYKAQLSDKEQK